jgi:hypothetical protein
MPKNWKDCGYLALTKNKKGVLLVLEHKRYFLKLDEVKSVLDGKREYTLVYHHVGKDLNG